MAAAGSAKGSRHACCTELLQLPLLLSVLLMLLSSTAAALALSLLLSPAAPPATALGVGRSAASSCATTSASRWPCSIMPSAMSDSGSPVCPVLRRGDSIWPNVPSTLRGPRASKSRERANLADVDQQQRQQMLMQRGNKPEGETMWVRCDDGGTPCSAAGSGRGRRCESLPCVVCCLWSSDSLQDTLLAQYTPFPLSGPQESPVVFKFGIHAIPPSESMLTRHPSM